MTYRKMLVEDWIKVEDNPIQRDTEKHAVRAKHLLTPHPSHSYVFAAELPSGKLIKLDGHTRALMWRRKDVAAPMQVFVAVIPCKDKAEAEQMYKDFDSKDALETTKDKVYGAFNRHNFEPISGLLQTGSITAALRIAWGVHGGGTVSRGSAGSQIGKSDIYTMIDEFSYELHALDGFKLQQGAVPSAVVAAFVLSYRRYGHKLTPFWRGVFGNTGTKLGAEMDGVQAIHELILKRRGSYGGSAMADMCARCLMAVEKWLKDESLTQIPRPLDTLGYLVGYEQPNERLIKKVDAERKRA